MMKHPTWKRRLDGISFMDVFDECIRKYKPQGKYFLSLFFNQYSLRIQDKKRYLAENKNMTAEDYIDSRDSVFENAESINIDTNDDEKRSKRKSPLDEQSKRNFFNDMLLDYGYLYQKLSGKLSSGIVPYLKYYITVKALLARYPAENVSDDYMDKEFFLAQASMTDKYMQEYERERALGNNKQEEAFLRGKYTAAVADIFGLSTDYMRKILKKTQDEITQIGIKL